MLVDLCGEIEDTTQWKTFAGPEWDSVTADDLVGIVKSLWAAGYVSATQVEKEEFVVAVEGRIILTAGASPEFAFCEKLRGKGGEIKLGETGEEDKLGMGQCMAKKWIARAGDGVKLTAAAPVVDETLVALRAFEAAPEATPEASRKELEKRKLVKKQKKISFKTTKGPKYATERKKEAADLTQAMLEDGSWETTTFKPHNFHALGAPVGGGTLHPLLKVRFEFRKILLGMGFEEMPTSRWVESSFWNFDSLFQPQQHPARDAHDTFFISGQAAKSDLDRLDPAYVERVKNVHERGGYGSFGYKYDWSREEAQKNVLRTHTTAISSQMLYALANQPGGFQPKKYFSVDRVFRNETVDKTHLAEFHQVEGLVADYGLTLGDLKGTIRAFFNAIGITRVRFKAAYNPYTEPSMEIFGFHPQLNRWTEIGNSGIFRPEMLLPMGLPENVRVIAWGLSLERPTMIMTGEDHIKNLFGSGVSFEMMRSFPLARFKVDTKKSESVASA